VLIHPTLPVADLAHAHAAVGAASWHQLAGKRVFLSGGTGFVGKWLLATLLDANQKLGLHCELVVLTRNPEAFVRAAPHLANAQCLTLVAGDVRNFEFPDGDFTHVIHAATDVVKQTTPRDTFATCVEGTRRVVELAVRSNATDFLLLSSGAVYGQQPPTLNRIAESYAGAPDPLSPASAYGEGKRVAEWLCAVQAKESSLRTKIARCFAFVGPYLPLDKHFAVGNFLRDAMNGNKIVIQGDGTPRRTYLHAADMAAWLWATLLRGRSGAAYNVGGDEVISIAELAHRVVDALDSTAAITTMRRAPEGQVADRYVPDVTRARTELELPDPIPLDDAIKRTARWHRELTHSS
jgi:nucleoside-diphosphate-sugar epimerase